MCAYLLDSKLSLSAKQHAAEPGTKSSGNVEWGVARELMLKVGILMLPIAIALFSLIYSMTLVSAAKIGTDGAIKETVLLMKETIKPMSNTLNSFNQQNLLLGHLDHLIENESFGNKEKHLLLSETHQVIEIPSWYSAALNNIDIVVSGDKLEWLSQVPLTVTPSAVDETIHIDGQDYIAIGMMIPALGWRYFRLIPKEQLTAPLISIFNFMLLGFLLIAIIAGIIYDHIFRNYVTSRLDLLTKAAKSLATGDPNARVGNLGYDEIGQAAIAFDKMASSFECHRNIECLLNRLEHDYLDGKKSKVLLDDACRHLANIAGFPLVWVALQREDRLQVNGVGGALALDFKSYESSALSFCAEALKSHSKSYLHSGEAAYPGGPSGQAAVFPLSLGTDVIGAIVFHASAKTGFVADQWNAMHYWSDRLQHTLHVMENEREMLDVRLRMLQAQIEPHFLVNTLSNIITQVTAKPAVAKHMLTLLASYMKNTPTALIVEDEPALAEWLISRLEELWPELNVIGKATNGLEAIEMLDDLTPDVAFMDIQLPGCTGIEAATEASHQCQVVFLTAFDQHAITAFEVGACDYLLKPVEDKPLLRAITRLKAGLNAGQAITSLEHASTSKIYGTESQLQWIQASCGDTIEFVPVDQVEAFISREKSTYCWANQKQYLLRSNLKDLEDKLNNDRFWRIHRNAIVSVSAIDKVKRDSFGLSVWLKGYMRPLHVSRPHAWRFRAL